MRKESSIRGMIYLISSFFTLSCFFYSAHFLDYRHVDDAYIYLQVVRNIVSGHGWLYNVGEDPVNLATDITFTAFLVPIYVLVESLSQIVSFIKIDMSLAIQEVISSTTIATVTWLALKHFPLSLRICFSLTLAFQTLFIKTSGMDSSFFIAVLCITCFLYCRKKYFLTGIMLCISGLTRTEGYALTVLVFALYLYDNRSISTRMLLGFMIPTLMWYVFAILYFGDYLPHSARVKMLISGDEESQYRIGSEFFQTFISQPRSSVIPAILATLGLWQLFRYWKQRQTYLLLLFGLGLAQLVAYSYKGAASSYFWYFVPANVAASIICVAGLHFLVQHFYKRSNCSDFCANLMSNTRINTAVNILLGVLFAAFISFYGIRPYESSKIYRFSEDYTAIGEWINANSEPGQKVASWEIGYIGFYSQRPMIDTTGLLNKDAIEAIKRKKWNWWYELRPQLIVKMTGVPLTRLGHRDKKFKEFFANYKLLKTEGSVQVWGRK